MQAVSNESGWEHDGRYDFKKRVDDSLAQPKAAKPSQAAKTDDRPTKFDKLALRGASSTAPKTFIAGLQVAALT